MTLQDARRVRIGVDVGGTFTDFVACDEESGELLAEKVLTTEEDRSEGVLEAFRQSRLDGASVSDFIHGTTAARTPSSRARHRRRRSSPPGDVVAELRSIAGNESVELFAERRFAPDELVSTTTDSRGG
jgi:hypothetical protein